MNDDRIPFVKMHGLGNDYVYLDEREVAVDDARAWAPALADRHEGIGGDGLIVLRRDPKYVCRMEMYNADGSRAEMCGNGIRCVARLAWERGYADDPEFEIDTDDGPKRVRILPTGHSAPGESSPVEPALRVQVEMGVPTVEEVEAVVEAEGRQFHGTILSLGNPHFVIEIHEDLASYPVHRHGPPLEHHPRFPGRTNVEFVRILGPAELDFRVWERGSGETRACGTGATAAVAALHRRGKLVSPTIVHLPGGDLEIAIDPDGSTWMTGPATTVFAGSFSRALVEPGESAAGTG